jgi:hypothetical protein
MTAVEGKLPDDKLPGSRYGAMTKVFPRFDRDLPRSPDIVLIGASAKLRAAIGRVGPHG